MHQGEKHGLYTNDDWIFIRVGNKEQCPDTAGRGRKISGSDFIFLVYLNWEMSTEKLIYPRVPGNNVSSCPILQTCKCKTDKMDINHILFTQLTPQICIVSQFN